MTRSTWSWQGLCILGVLVGLGLPGSGWAQEKKVPPKTEDGPKVIIIQLDASKLPPDVLKQLMSLAQQGTAKGGDKKPEPKKEDSKKEEPKKGEPKKPNLVLVDVNKLSPDLAKQLMAELAKIKGKEGEKGNKNEGNKKGKKDKDDDDDDKKGSKKKDKDDDDDKKEGKKKKDKDDD